MKNLTEEENEKEFEKEGKIAKISCFYEFMNKDPQKA